MKPAWTASEADAGTRLDKFLAAPDRLGSRGKVATALERGKIFLNDAEATLADASRRLSAGDRLEFWMDRPGSAARKPGAAPGNSLILYEDAALIVLNKPPGMLSVPLERRAGAMSAYDHIEDHLRSSGKRRPLVVHRIDLDTSGLVIFAKTTLAQEQLKAQFRRREPERVYWAVVLRPSRSRVGSLDRYAGLGPEGAHPEGDTSERSARHGSGVALSRARMVPRRVTDRSAPADRQAQSDPDSGAAPRAHAGRREAIRLRPGPAAPDSIRASGAARVPARLRPPGGWAATDVRGAAAERLHGPAAAAARHCPNGTHAPAVTIARTHDDG